MDTVTHNLTNIHGARTASEVLALYDAGTLNTGDTILCHSGYRLRIGQQTRAEIYKEARAIQSYGCPIDPVHALQDQLRHRINSLSNAQCESLIEHLNNHFH